jgi:hypothetical protein
MAIQQPIVIEPRMRTPAPGVRDTTGTTSLPPEMVQEQCARLALLYGVSAAVWTVGFVMRRWVLPVPDKSVHVVVISGAAIAASLLFLAYARFSP